MGGAQSAQREDKQDSAAEEESGKVDDTQTAQHFEDKSLKNNGQVSEISGKADGVIAEVNCHCEDEIAAEAVVSPDEDVSESEKPLKEETKLENLEINENESRNVTDATEEVPLEMIEINAKQNDINESFRFVSNINLKLTVKRNSAEKDDIAADVPDDTTKDEPSRPEGIKDKAKENKSEDVENNTNLNAQETYDHDSTCPTQTDITSEEVLDNARAKTTETKEDVYFGNVPTTTSPVSEDERVQQNATSEEEVVLSPIKRFFTTGIFSGLRKKKKPAEDETTEKEMLNIRKVEATEATEQTLEVQEHDKEISLGIEAVKVETEHKKNGLKEEILSAASPQITDEGKSHSTDPSTITANEPEILSSQEKDKVQASPLKRLLSGSSLKKSSKKQKERKSSDAKLSDSGEHVSNQLLSSTDAADNQTEVTPTGEEDGAWASFKKLVTPKKRMKRSSLTNEETQNPSSVQESKSSEGEQISDDSTEESKKRKESSVSWEAVLCGSGRRRRSRSRKTSDSEDEKPQIENDSKKQESPLESSNEIDVKQAGSNSEGDGGSTWKSFKKLVSLPNKGKEEDIQSDGEVTQDDSSFSIKRLLPKQKKRRSVEKQDYVSSDEADMGIASGDEDSETPAVVPLSEFDTAETAVCLQTHADIESHVPKEADCELQQELERMAEPVLLCDTLQSEAENVQEDALKTEKSTTPASNDEPDEITELISKHQQLSDIPEEGIITESMVTPASFTEEPARDDTIAEDFIEITSEAITAPEPVDITLADETELISAVSQLSDSSKTSGNTTPVPAEYDIKDTEVILQQVVENISINPKAVPLCSDKINSEIVVASVSCQILETFVKQQPTILEIHKKSDATSITIGLNVEELDVINELAATAQTESIAEVSEAASTEIASEVSTEFDTAEISVDEIHKVSITHTEESIKELESTNESQDLTECQVYEALSKEILPESEKTVECSPVETQQAETDTLQTDIQEAETKDGGVEEEVQTVLETKDEIMQNITDQVQAEHQDHPPEVVQELQALATVETNTFNSEKDIVKSNENKATSEGILAAERVIDEPNKEKKPFTEVSVEPEMEDELQADTAKTELCHVPEGIPEKEADTDEHKEETKLVTEVHVQEKEGELQAHAANNEHEQVPEVLTIHTAALDSQIGSLQIPGRKIQLSEEIQSEETERNEPKEETKPVTEVHVEPEENAANTEHEQVPEVLAVHAAALNSELGSNETPGTKVPSSDNIPLEEAVSNEPKEETGSVTEVNVKPENEDELQADVDQTEHGQVPEVLTEQAAVLDSEMGHFQPGRRVPLSEDITQTETVEVNQKGQPEPLIEDSVEPEKEVGLPKTEHIQVSQVLDDVQPTALALQISSIQIPEKDVSDDIPAEEAVLDKPKEEIKPVTDVNVEPEKKAELQPDAAKGEHIEVPEILALQKASLDSQISRIHIVEKEVLLSQDIEPARAVIDEPNNQSEPLNEVHGVPEMEDELQIEYGQVPEVLAVQAAALDSELGSIQTPSSLEKLVKTEETRPTETITNEPIQATEGRSGPEEEILGEDAKTKCIQETEVLPCDAKEIVTEAKSEKGRSMPGHITESVEEEEDEEQEDIYHPDTDYVIASITDEIENEVVAEVNQDLINKDQTTESIPQDVQVDQEDRIPEDVDKLQTLSAVHVPSVNEESTRAPVLEKKVISEETPVPCVDNATATYESKYEVHFNEVQGNVEGQKEAVLPGAEIKTSTVEHAVAGHVITCNLKEVSVAIPDVLTEKSSDSLEPLIDKVTSELELKEEAETATPLEKDDRIRLVVDKLQTSAVQVSSVNQESTRAPVLEKKVISEETPVPCVANAAVTYESKYEVHFNEVQGNVEGEKEAVLPGAEIKTSTVEHAVAGHIITCNLKEVSVAIPDVLIEKSSDSLEPLIDKVTSELELKEEAQIATPLEKDDRIRLVVDKLQTSAVQVSSVNEESTRAPVLEKKVISEETPVPCVDNAAVTYESKYEVHFNEVQGNVEGEKEAVLPGAEIKTSTVEHAVVGHVITCNLKEVSVAIPDVLIEKSSDSLEPLIDKVTSELELKEEAEIATPLEKDDRIRLVVDKLQTSAVQVSSVNQESTRAPVLEKKVISEETPVPCVDNAGVTYESKYEVHFNEVQGNVEGEKEAVLPGAEIKTSTVEHAVAGHVITCNLKEVSVAIPDVLTEKSSDSLEPLIDKVTSELELKEEAQIATPLEKDDRIRLVVDKLQTSAVQVSSVNEESTRAPLLEKKVISEETPVPCVDNAAVTYESKYEVHFNEVQGNVEGEKEAVLPGAEIKTSTVEHAVVGHVITCNLKEVSVAIPDVLTEKSSDSLEPLIDKVTSELELKEEAEIATPLVRDDVTKTATDHSVVLMMHVPSTEFEDSHRIQVQVVDVDIKSAEMIVDSAPEVGITEAKEVIDVCQETLEILDKLSATETEEELIHEENKMITHKVIQHVKENLPERVVVQTSIKDEVVNLEYKKQPDVTELREVVESKSNEVENQKVMEDTSETFSQRQDEVPVISDDPATEQLESEDVIQTLNIPDSSSGNVSIHDHKEDLAEHKTELKKPEAYVTTEDVKLSSEGLERKRITEEAQPLQSSQSQTVIVNKTELEVPQNTGIISSIGNMESPSSLSLEFKLNIQFGQAKAPTSPPLATQKMEPSPSPATERTKPVIQTKVSGVGIQAVEPQNPINATGENQKKTVLTEVTVEATEITEPKCGNIGSTETAAIMNQPVLLDISIQAMETVQIESTERLSPNVQATEKIQAGMQIKKSKDFLGHPVLYEACSEEIKVEEPVKEIEEENDQDLWVDAEEDIHTQQESDMSIVKVEGSTVNQTESDQEEKAELEYEFEMAPEMAPKSKTKEEENQQEMHKMKETCETENEGEEFAVALEHPETSTAAGIEQD